MSPTQIVVIVILVLVVAALVVGVRSLARRRSLRDRFGPEYDRLVAERDSRTAAERELRDRERRHAELTLTPLDPQSRARYAAAWEELQVRFVDSPAETVGDADELVSRLIAERGYPTGDFSDQIAHLSVEHARTLGHYRDAHEIHLRNSRGEASTEDLRQALVHYRALFADLLGEEPVTTPRPPEQRRPDGDDTPDDTHAAGTRPRPDAGRTPDTAVTADTTGGDGGPVADETAGDVDGDGPRHRREQARSQARPDDPREQRHPDTPHDVTSR